MNDKNSSNIPDFAKGRIWKVYSLFAQELLKGLNSESTFSQLLNTKEGLKELEELNPKIDKMFDNFYFSGSTKYNFEIEEFMPAAREWAIFVVQKLREEVKGHFKTDDENFVTSEINSYFSCYKGVVEENIFQYHLMVDSSKNPDSIGITAQGYGENTVIQKNKEGEAQGTKDPEFEFKKFKGKPELTPDDKIDIISAIKSQTRAINKDGISFN